MRSSTLLVEAARRLAAAGVESPRVDAELLLAHVLGVPRGRLLTLDEVAEDDAAGFGTLVGLSFLLTLALSLGAPTDV